MPVILPELMISVQGGLMPPTFFAYMMGIFAIPFVMTGLAVKWFWGRPELLFAWGYGVEAPLMIVLGFRVIAIRDMTPATAFIIFTALFGFLAYGLHLVLTRNQPKVPQQHGGLTAMWFLTLSLLLVVGFYFVSWISFFIPPVTSAVFGEIGWIIRDPYFFTGIVSFGEFMLVLFGITLFSLTSVLLVVLPIVVSVLYVRAWLQSARSAEPHIRWSGVIGTLAIIAVLWVAGFALTNQQPQQAAFALLETEPATLGEAADLLTQQEEIKAGLLNAYLAPFRYLSADGESDVVLQAYTYEFDMNEAAALRWQARHDVLARPILYRPVHADLANTKRWGNQVFDAESEQAAELYQAYFDTPIIEGEQDEIVNAVGQTVQFERGREAVRAVAERDIHLARQELNIVEHGDWAEVELYEVYENQTLQQEEVVYYFSLPESAVLTGVWLGNSDNRDDRFVYRVAPRGAAQEVYQQQVRVRQDPALLEQVGPTQYRLRVFPVEPMTRDWRANEFSPELKEAPSLHMWLTFNVLADGDQWPMPRLAEQFNIYWDRRSDRFINGERVRLDDETWLPESVEAAGVTPFQTRTVDLGNGARVTIEQPAQLESLAADTRLAVVLDRSYSMNRLSGEVDAALAALEGFAADVYLTASDVSPEDPLMVPLNGLNTDELIYFGGQHPATLLGQFYELREDRQYDAILVVTDGSGYELGPATEEIPVSDTPLWFVHLGGEMPIGYDDDTLQAIQSSGGGATGTVDEALLRMANQAADGSVQLIDGLLWRVEQNRTTRPVTDPSFAPFATRALILSEMVRQRQNLDQLEALDELHALAVENSIVTAYSSMIVLVTAAQERLLDELEQDEDRFDREYEEVGETQEFNVTGVPEPHEWALLIMTALLGVWYWWKRPELSLNRL